MPKLLIIRQFIFLLFSADVRENRKHIHVEVRKGKRRYVAKFWLEPAIELIEKGNLSSTEANDAKKLIEKNYHLLLKQIAVVLRGDKVKTIIK